MTLVRAAATGVWAALRVPLWLHGRRWTELLRPPEPAGAAVRAPRGAEGAAVRAVAMLGTVPGLPWKNTCLYRSVAQCLALRAFGVPAVVRIGVRSGDGAGVIAAHAWVVRDPAAEPPAPDAMTAFPLR
ncbi:MAG TPA: lasso peptide biosynthesis B2 protein [Longimicrobium sp.]|jgi:hypothetical protein|uniref:lasso peptide biosynthesis B2 protein n=1 Tax=Longimicrobium sp. TaxID=2029185 RepID=UPI002EDA1944